MKTKTARNAAFALVAMCFCFSARAKASTTYDFSAFNSYWRGVCGDYFDPYPSYMDPQVSMFGLASCECSSGGCEDTKEEFWCSDVEALCSDYCDTCFAGVLSNVCGNCECAPIEGSGPNPCLGGN